MKIGFQFLFIALVIYLCLPEAQGEPLTETIPNTDYYYKRIHTARLEGSTGQTVYWVNLYVGTPPQKQTAIIDTGSTLFAFPCSECQESCGTHLNKQFDMDKSSTVKKMDCVNSIGNYRCSRCNQSFKGSNSICHWSVSYMEGSSISGYMAADYIVLGDEIQDYIDSKKNNTLTSELEEEYFTFMNHERVFAPFGCTISETHLFKTQTPDGIIGLGPSSNSAAHPPNIIDQIFQSHITNGEQLVFSLCLNAEEGGYMSVGGYNHELHIPNAKTQIITFNPSSGFYDVTIKNIRMNGQIVESNIPYPIVDSGTTLVFGPSSIINNMAKAINEACNNDARYSCGGYKAQNQKSTFIYRKSDEYPTVKDFLDSFPVFQFDFESDGSVTIEWNAHGYLYVDPSSRNPFLYQFAFEPIPVSSRKMYLGGPFMKNYDILFDKNNKQIHFTPSQCTLPHINSILMNNHTNHMRKTIQDEKYISELIEFQKTFNYSSSLLSNKTESKPKINPDNMIQEEEEPAISEQNLKKEPLSTTTEPSEFQVYFLYGVSIFLLASLIYCCKHTMEFINQEQATAIPNQQEKVVDIHPKSVAAPVLNQEAELKLLNDERKVDIIPQNDISVIDQVRGVQVLGGGEEIDEDDVLDSEEGNEYGYKNDPTYQENELNKDPKMEKQTKQGGEVEEEEYERIHALDE